MVLVRLGPPMVLQRVRRREAFAALLTHERLLAGMKPHVILEGGRPREALLADLALEMLTGTGRWSDLARGNDPVVKVAHDVVRHDEVERCHEIC